MQSARAMLVWSLAALVVGCRDTSQSIPAAAGSASPVAGQSAAVLPDPPFEIAAPTPPNAMFANRDLSQLSPDALVYLGYQARAKGNHFAELQFKHWAVANGGGSQYNLACAYALNKEVEPAFYWLQRAAREDGVDAAHAEKDSDLKIVRADKRWKRIAAYLKQTGSYWRQSGVHDEILILPAGHTRDQKIPIVIGLHGMGTSAKEFNSDRYPELATRLNVAFLMVSGTEPTGPKSFNWSADQDRNSRRVEQALESIADRLDTTGQRLLFGFSQGATAAVEIAARHPDRYAGAIAMSAGVDPVPRAGHFAQLPEHARQSYVIVCGDDEHPMTIATTRAYADLVAKLGAQLTRKEYPGVSQHSFPPDFDEQFPLWTKAILQIAADNN